MGNSKEGQKGAHVEVGREVTDFVRIFARPMRDAKPNCIVVLKNIIERVFEILSNLWHAEIYIILSAPIDFIKINLHSVVNTIRITIIIYGCNNQICFIFIFEIIGEVSPVN